MEFDEEEVLAHAQGTAFDVQYADNEGLYSESQLLTLQITGMGSAFLSVMGSSLIVNDILKKPSRRANLKSVYKRLMLGFSILDIMVGLGHSLIFGPFSSVPKEVDFVFAPQGNWTTCGVSGFFGLYTIGLMLYSTWLALYFVLLINFKMREESMKRCLEPFMHFLALGFPGITGIIAFDKGYMNPLLMLPGQCWLSVYPPGCSNSGDKGVPCERGGDSRGLSMFAMTAMFGLSFIFNIIGFLLVVCKVSGTENRTARHIVDANRRFVRTRQTAIQALLYVSAFLITYTPLVVLQVVTMVTKLPQTKENRDLYFPLAFIAKLLPNMQGGWCCLIYFYRKKKPKLNSTTTSSRRSSSRRSRSSFRSSFRIAEKTKEFDWQNDASEPFAIADLIKIPSKWQLEDSSEQITSSDNVEISADTKSSSAKDALPEST